MYTSGTYIDWYACRTSSELAYSLPSKARGWCETIASTYHHTHTHAHTRAHTEEKYGREVRVLPTDFSRGEEVYPEIAEKLKDLDIGILGKI